MFLRKVGYINLLSSGAGDGESFWPEGEFFFPNLPFTNCSRTEEIIDYQRCGECGPCRTRFLSLTQIQI